MTRSFDNEISRKNTGSVKWEIRQDRDDPGKWVRTDAYFGKDRMLPMWVADMDLACPEHVVAALKKRADHPIFGYTMAGTDYFDAVCAWMERRHGWAPDPGWIVTAPGVVPALHVLVRALTAPGQKVLVQQPVYYPFFSAIQKNQRHLVSNSLVLKDGRYVMDLDDLEKKTADPDLTLAILCSPHNPVGRVWTPDELRAFGEICLKNNVRVISDEIHCDLLFNRTTFTPFAALGHDFAGNAVICTAPSKTFNLAGLQASNIIIQDPGIRKAFADEMAASAMGRLNPFGIEACKAAYTHGDAWLDRLLTYLDGNLEALTGFFSREIPFIPIIAPQGTYLVWFDCRALNLEPLALRDLMLNTARVVLDEGYIFGPEGAGFERINIACPRPVLMEAARRIADAVKTVRKR
ncbi:MAG: MalY/PatB family protein [Pseudomonadota bacterium]